MSIFLPPKTMQAISISGGQRLGKQLTDADFFLHTELMALNIPADKKQELVMRLDEIVRIAILCGSQLQEDFS